MLRMLNEGIDDVKSRIPQCTLSTCARTTTPRRPTPVLWSQGGSLSHPPLYIALQHCYRTQLLLPPGNAVNCWASASRHLLLIFSHFAPFQFAISRYIPPLGFHVRFSQFPPNADKTTFHLGRLLHSTRGKLVCPDKAKQPQTE
jgi:hypothetical protein